MRGRAVLFVALVALLSAGCEAKDTDTGADAGTDAAADAGDAALDASTDTLVPVDTSSGEDTQTADVGPTSCRPNPGETVSVESGGNYLANNRFAPDSESLAVVAYAGLTGLGLRVVDLCGDTVTDLGNNDGPRTNIAWSPDGNVLYYVTSGGVSKIDATGGTPWSFIEGATSFDVSPDGTTFVSSSDSNTLTVYEPLGFTATELAVTGIFPRYAPDGTRIAFVDDGTLRVITLADASVADVGAIEGSAFQPFDWLDNTRFAIVGSDGIQVATPDGQGAYTRETMHAVTAAQDLDVSPDGTMISYRVNGTRPVVLLGVE